MIFLVTGGAGFVGSSLAMRLKAGREGARVIALDNLMRRGSDLNVARLRQAGVEFVHGDVRQRSDLASVGRIDCVIDCAAEPSVQAGYGGSPDYVVDTNLVGTINALDLARRHGASFIFLSTSRVYPYELINGLAYEDTPSRFRLAPGQNVPGVSDAGFSESLPLGGLRSLYGATKLAAELLVSEYLAMYSLRGVINRCGVIAGPWQMGRVDQGFVAYWAARHLFGGPLAYKGFGGSGKQVRDVMHAADLHALVERQIEGLDRISGQTFNVGGGIGSSVSLCELTDLCARLTGNRRELGPPEDASPADVRLYVSDCRKVEAATGWRPATALETIVEETLAWLADNRQALEPVFQAP
jgi:CDP-paratose 2-epimerase